jgi:hypothetical protein
MHLKNAVLSALLVKIEFEFIPTVKELGACVAINRRVALNFFGDFQIDRTASLAIQL